MRCWPSSIQSTSVAFENNDMEYEGKLVAWCNEDFSRHLL